MGGLTSPTIQGVQKMPKQKGLINQINGWQILVGLTAGLIFLSACHPLKTTTFPSTEAQATATQEASEVAAARNAVQSFYEFLSAKDYEAAYALLSKSQPHLQALEEWTADQQLLINAIQLLDIQHYPDFQATVMAASEGTASQQPLEESSRCKVFVVTVDVDYVGGWGAEPSGEDSSFVVVIREGDAWRLAGIYSGIGRDACQTH